MKEMRALALTEIKEARGLALVLTEVEEVRGQALTEIRQARELVLTEVKEQFEFQQVEGEFQQMKGEIQNVKGEMVRYHQRVIGPVKRLLALMPEEGASTSAVVVVSLRGKNISSRTSMR